MQTEISHNEAIKLGSALAFVVEQIKLFFFSEAMSTH